MSWSKRSHAELKELSGKAWEKANEAARAAVKAAGATPDFRDKYVNLRADGTGDVVVRLKWLWKQTEARTALEAAGYQPHTVTAAQGWADAVAVLVKVTFKLTKKQRAALERR